jgi:hypothetical protein
MKRPAIRNAVIAGSAVVLAGAFAGTLALSAGGPGTPAHPTAANAVRAQRVDAITSSAASPTVQQTPSSNTGPELINIKVKDDEEFTGKVCVDNSTIANMCTGEVGPSMKSAELSNVEITWDGDAAHLDTARVTGTFISPANVPKTIPVPVHAGDAQTHCFRFQKNWATTSSYTADFAEVSCDGF